MQRVCDCPERSGRFEAMEGLRGVAILAVFICHYDVLVAQKLPISASIASISGILGRLGTSGVDLFFVLSGFLIYRIALQPTLHYPAFVQRRVQRIYPPFLGVLLIFVVASLLAPSSSKIPKSPGLAAVTLLMNLAFFPGFVNVEPIVGVAWSLSYEWYFYLSLPFIIRALRIYKWSSRTRIAFFVLVCVLYIGITYCFPTIGSLTHISLYRSHVRLVMFVGGMIAYELLQMQKGTATSFWRPFEWSVLTASVFGFLTLMMIENHFVSVSTHSLLYPRYEAYRTPILLALFPAVLLCCCGAQGIFYRVLSTWELRWLGISATRFISHTLSGSMHFG